MTLDDLNRQHRVFIDFLAILGCETHFKIRPNSLPINQDKLRMKFSALNVDFNGPILGLQGAAKSGSLKFFAVLLAIVKDFNIKFYSDVLINSNLYCL